MNACGLAALALVALAVGCGQPQPAPRPVVLWEGGVVKPRFPVVPEAAWEPIHQRLRRGLEAGVAPADLLTCYSAGAPGAVVAFYAPLYGVEPGQVEWRPLAAERWRAQLKALGAAVGRDLGATPGGAVRRAELAQRGDLPELVLESPHLDAAAGSVVEGTLICLHWRAPASESTPGAP